MSGTANHYVDNKRFYEAMKVFIADYKQAKKDGVETPVPSNYICECLWLIASNLSNNRNFISYTYKDEMIGDAVENCLRYLHNFNPDKTKNPFAYFTQISYYAFLRRIEKEKRQTYIKYKLIENSLVNNTLVELPAEDQEHFSAVIKMLDNDKMEALSKRYDKKPKKKAKEGTLDKFIDKDNEDEQV